MPKGPKGEKRPADVIGNAVKIAKIATGEIEDDAPEDDGKDKAAPDGAGDVWTWTALDSETKMILSYEVGDRSSETAIEFMDDLRDRLANRVQLTTDGHKAYLEAVEGAFGADIDYAMLVKLYGELTGQKGHERKYSPAECTGVVKRRIEGNPDPDAVSTSHVERHNLTMRMGMRRFTRLLRRGIRQQLSRLHGRILGQGDGRTAAARRALTTRRDKRNAFDLLMGVKKYNERAGPSKVDIGGILPQTSPRSSGRFSVADISSSDVSHFRHRVAQALDPELRCGPGLSPTNVAIISLILTSIVLGIIETEEAIVGDKGHIFMAAEGIIFVLFLIEYVLRVWSSIENPRYASRWDYARKPAPLLDLATLVIIGASLAGTQGFLLRLARLFRLVRLAKLGRFSDSWVMLSQALSNRRYELAMSVGLAILLMIITSSLLYVAEGDVQPEEFGSIPRAMWWSIVTLTTVGYGDVVPITVLGKAFAALAAVAGVGLIAMPAGIIAGAFSEVIQERRRASEKDDRQGVE